MNIQLHEIPPAPFNPDFDPRAAGWLNRAANSMEDDDFYATHTRIECAVEIRRRYNALAREAA